MQHLSLTLWIQDCRCKCGNHWVNSQILLRLGGTPAAVEAERGQVTRLYSSKREHSHCFRCYQLKPEPTTEPDTVSSKTLWENIE